MVENLPLHGCGCKESDGRGKLGDGPVSNPQKDILNTALYEAEKVIKGFQNYMGDADEAYAALKEVHAKADGVYNKADATTEEYLSAIEEVNAP